MNRIDLEGRVAVITGGAQGIGYAIAERMLASGAAVSLWDADAGKLAEAKGTLGNAGRVFAEELDLTDEALAAAGEGSRRLGEFARRLQAAVGAADDTAFSEAAEQLERGFIQALDEDLNAPRAVAEVFDFVSTGNRLLDQGRHPGKRALQAWKFVDSVLDAATVPQVFKVQLPGTIRPDSGAATLFTEALPGEAATQAAWAQYWADKRRAAKAKRDFAEADRIRGLLAGNGWQVRDLKDGGSEVSRS
jgi:cysteinyl-tRNA synthetase